MTGIALTVIEGEQGRTYDTAVKVAKAGNGILIDSLETLGRKIETRTARREAVRAKGLSIVIAEDGSTQSPGLLASPMPRCAAGGRTITRAHYSGRDASGSANRKVPTMGVKCSTPIDDWIAAPSDAVANGTAAAAIHAACYLANNAITARAFTPEDALGDRGLVHELAHVAAGDVTRDLPALADWARRLEKDHWPETA